MRRFLARLFAQRTDPTSTPDRRSPLPRLYGGHETLEVVGESHYQDALWRLVGGRTTEPVRYDTTAELIAERNNPYDDNAIAVSIGGETVGHLSREDAAVYRPGLQRLITKHSGVAFRATIVGGGPRGSGVGYLGVFLHHDPADFGLPAHHVSVGTLRTGLSESRATNTDNLSWYRRLPADDAGAIAELRKLLQIEDHPIERHYILAELEHHLYKCRTTNERALEEFDALCRTHDEEMPTIRPALLAEFDGLPLIMLYRQAAIRWQKAKHWEEVRRWATRGVAIYGSDALRPGDVDDLLKRIAYATAKLDANRGPRVVRPPNAHTSASAKAEAPVETLVCETCGAQFDRPRSRGRKPKQCQDCRRSGGGSRSV
jgi:hypothetical protein